MAYISISKLMCVHVRVHVRVCVCACVHVVLSILALKGVLPPVDGLVMATIGLEPEVIVIVSDRTTLPLLSAASI